MSRDDLKEQESYSHPKEKNQKRPIDHETDKTGQRQGVLIKKERKKKT